MTSPATHDTDPVLATTATAGSRRAHPVPVLLAAGIDPRRVSKGVDLLPVGLVAGGFSALAAGIAVAGFLLTWLRPVRANARALAG